MDPVRRFARTLAQRLSETPGGPHRAVSLEEIRGRLLPYRAYRSSLGFDSVEDYDAVVLRLAAEEGGYVRTFPPQAADRFRAEAGLPLPNLDLLDALGEVTIQIGTDALARILVDALAPAPPAVRGDLDIIERHLDLQADEPVEVAPPPPPLVMPERPLSAAFPRREARAAPGERPASGPAASLDRLPGSERREAAPTPTPPEIPLMSQPTAESCRACRQSLPAGRPVIFCPWCGARLVPFTCPQCRTELESDWRHCITCGTPVKDPHRLV